MQTTNGSDHRRIWVRTLDGSVEGTVVLGPTVRLLDDLNLPARPFLMIEPIHLELGRPLVRGSTLAINKETILFVAELSPYTPQRRDQVRLARAPVALEVGPFTVRGFVHVPVGGDPLQRLNQATHPFVAVTSASVIGPETELAAGFLAIHKRHVALAQRSTVARADAEAVLAERVVD